MRSLRQCLLDLEIVHLRYIARYWDLDLTSKRQRDIAEELANAMPAEHTVHETWESLPENERQALDTLLSAGGHMPFRVFTRNWGEVRSMGPGRMAREKPWDAPVSPAEGLWLKGFISRTFEQSPEESYEAVFIPQELLVHLPVPETSTPHIDVQPVSIPRVVVSAGDKFLDDLCTILACIQNTPIKAGADGTWPSVHETRLRAQLRDAERERLLFLHHIIKQLKWLQASATHLMRLDAATVTPWLQSSPQEQRQKVVQAWKDDATWNELLHIRTLRAENRSVWRNDPLAARRAIIHHLGDCTPGAWYPIKGFATSVYTVDPDFLRPSGDYDTWYIRDLTTYEYLSGFGSWNGVEARLIRQTITAPLAWLGLVDLGAETPEGPVSTFCITPAGAVFLEKETEPPEPSKGQLVLDEDFSVHVPASRRYERFQLARVADWVSSGDTFTYRITPASLERGRQQGIPVARMLDFLQRATKRPIPRIVEAALTRWDARGVEAHLDRAVILRLASEELLKQVLESPLSRELIQEPISTTTALVRQEDWPRIVVALAKMGLLAEIGVTEEPYAR